MHNATPQTPSATQAPGKIVTRVGSAFLGFSRLVLLWAFVPTWILDRLGHDLGYSLVFAASTMTFAGLMLTITLLEVGESAKKLAPIRQTALSLVMAVLLMLVFGALHANVGFVHVLLAFTLPSAIVRAFSELVKRLRGEKAEK